MQQRTNTAAFLPNTDETQRYRCDSPETAGVVQEWLVVVVVTSSFNSWACWSTSIRNAKVIEYMYSSVIR
jgi:hypothetical protein